MEMEEIKYFPPEIKKKLCNMARCGSHPRNNCAFYKNPIAYELSVSSYGSVVNCSLWHDIDEFKLLMFKVKYGRKT